MSASVTVQVFSKAPQLGRVKSRLARTVGEARALALYKKMLACVASNVAHFQNTVAGAQHDAVPAMVEVWVSGAAEEPYLDALIRRYGFDRFAQSAHVDLGERIIYSVGSVVEKKCSVIIVGGDSVAADGAYLHEAYGALRAGRDLVLGPAYDGGYILIGLSERFLRRSAAQWMTLFRGIPWGEDQVMIKTLLAAQRIKAHTYLLDTCFDVDVEEDLVHFSDVL